MQHPPGSGTGAKITYLKPRIDPAWARWAQCKDLANATRWHGFCTENLMREYDKHHVSMLGFFTFCLGGLIDIWIVHFNFWTHYNQWHKLSHVEPKPTLIRAHVGLRWAYITPFDLCWAWITPMLGPSHADVEPLWLMLSQHLTCVT